MINKNVSSKHDGYILMTTFSLMAIALFVVSAIFNRGIVYVPSGYSLIAREKAKMIALSSISIAQAILAEPPSGQKKDEKSSALKKTSNDQDKKNKEEQTFFARLFPIVNKWQIFQLKESIEGIDAEIGLKISCEDGKINLNRIFDFAKGEFTTQKGETSFQELLQGAAKQKTDWKKFIQELCNRIDQKIGTKKLFDSLMYFLKKRHYPLNDVTQLFDMPDNGEIIKKTMRFEFPGVKKKEKESDICITDIFTVYGTQRAIEPWVLADSLAQLLELTPISEFVKKDTKSEYKKIIQSFKVSSNWKTEWDTLLKPIFGKQLQTLPESIDSFLTKTFDPRTFMVLSYAIVNKVTVRLCAILARVKQREGNQDMYELKVKKLYWL